MKPSTIGSCVSECDGCDRQDPGDDLRRQYWHRSDELDLDLCPSCWDRLDDGGILQLSSNKLQATFPGPDPLFLYANKEREALTKPIYYFIVPAELDFYRDIEFICCIHCRRPMMQTRELALCPECEQTANLGQKI